MLKINKGLAKLTPFLLQANSHLSQSQPTLLAVRLSCVCLVVLWCVCVLFCFVCTLVKKTPDTLWLLDGLPNWSSHTLHHFSVSQSFQKDTGIQIVFHVLHYPILFSCNIKQEMLRACYYSQRMSVVKICW